MEYIVPEIIIKNFAEFNRAKINMTENTSTGYVIFSNLDKRGENTDNTFRRSIFHRLTFHISMTVSLINH